MRSFPSPPHLPPLTRSIEQHNAPIPLRDQLHDVLRLGPVGADRYCDAVWLHRLEQVAAHGQLSGEDQSQGHRRHDQPFVRLARSSLAQLIKVSPRRPPRSFSSSASFDCPLSESDITGFLGGSLDSLLNGGLSAITGGSRLHRRDADDDDDEEVRLRVARATRFALGKLFERGAEEVVETFGAAGRRYRIGTVVPPPPALQRG